MHTAQLFGDEGLLEKRLMEQIEGEIKNLRLTPMYSAGTGMLHSWTTYYQIAAVQLAKKQTCQLNTTAQCDDAWFCTNFTFPTHKEQVNNTLSIFSVINMRSLRKRSNKTKVPMLADYLSVTNCSFTALT